jgi:DNA-binding Xre family transcriptional regulator
MLSLEEILSRLKDRNLQAVAAGSGVSDATLYKLTNGYSKKVSYDVVKRLSDYLETNP